MRRQLVSLVLASAFSAACGTDSKAPLKQSAYFPIGAGDAGGADAAATQNPDAGQPITSLDSGATGNDGNVPELDAGGQGPTTDAASNPLDAGADSGADNFDASTNSDGSAASDANTGDAGVAHHDWVAGDYPPALHDQDYLEITGVPGQGDNVRGYKVHLPKGYDPSKPTPVVFAMHGLSQNPVMYAVDGANWPQKSDDNGFILVMPNGNVKDPTLGWGLAGSWNAGTCCGGAQQAGLNDVALIRAIYAQVVQHANVDKTRVYATGLSNGGFLSYRLACEASDLFVAVAPGSGAVGTSDIASYTMPISNDFKECKPTHHVSVLEMHGTADPLVPYSTVKPSLDLLATVDGCDLTTGPAAEPKSAGDTTCITYAGCPSGIEVTGCTVQGGGHCWFGSPDCGTGGGAIGNAVVGANSNTLVDTDAAWDFFKRHARP